MLNTKVYKSVYELAEALMDAANKEDRASFDLLYADLKNICVTNEKTNKDHPVQWETLADFTEELEDALAIYHKALAKAESINSKDYISSIVFSIAQLEIESGQIDAAIEHLKYAKMSANKIEDKAFRIEIDKSLNQLLGA